MASHDYLKKILTARVYDVARETELEPARNLSTRLRNPIYLKREDNQPVFSSRCAARTTRWRTFRPTRSRGVITASAGNHAQGVAFSAARMGVKAVIVVPVTTPQVKVDAVRARRPERRGDPGRRVVQRCVRACAQGAAGARLTFVHPFDDPYVIAGQGTIAMEVLRQHQGPIHAIFVPIGGGGLASGVAAYVKAVRPEIKVIGVQTEDSCAMAQSLQKGERVELSEVGLFADGTAVKLVGEETFRLCSELVDGVVTVDTDALCAAIKDVFQDTRSAALEPSGAGGRRRQALRGTRRDRESDARRGHLRREHELRPDALRGRTRGSGEAREAVFAVTIPEERGSFKRFCELVGDRSVTEFNYASPTKKRRTSSSACRSAGAASRTRSPRTSTPRLRDARPDARRTGQGAYPLHGRRPLAAGARRALFASSSRSGRAR
jgi:threonine dehydratase